jgi:alkanesulfonate monooxygenase SsuD/methylene tetrahydromethanopterin reductase-like flavin-dependent oxidoreductase (luciferase family)
MQFGVHLPNSGPFATPRAVHDMALAAERLGFDALCVHDHVNWGSSDRYHFYAGSLEAADTAEQPLAFLAACSTLAYVAGLTRRVRLIPAALCLGWRHPLLVAREAMTIHSLSGGRLVLCVCGGNVQRDFEVLGVPWEQRGRRTAESLQALRAIVDATGPVSFIGEHVRFRDAELYPAPIGMRLWYAGTTDVAVRRVARYCEGWMPAAGPEYVREQVPTLHRYAEHYGRADTQFELAVVCRSYIASSHAEAMAVAGRTLRSDLEAEWLTRHDIPDVSTTWFVGPPGPIVERIQEFERAGVTLILIAVIGHNLADMIDQMERFATQVMPMVGTPSHSGAS